MCRTVIIPDNTGRAKLNRLLELARCCQATHHKPISLPTPASYTERACKKAPPGAGRRRGGIVNAARVVQTGICPPGSPARLPTHYNSHSHVVCISYSRRVPLPAAAAARTRVRASSALPPTRPPLQGTPAGRARETGRPQPPARAAPRPAQSRATQQRRPAPARPGYSGKALAGGRRRAPRRLKALEGRRARLLLPPGPGSLLRPLAGGRAPRAPARDWPLAARRALG